MSDKSDSPPLHQLDPLERFSQRAENYVKYRPSYPAAAIDHILMGLGDPTRLAVADIGAGTGISSRLLAERGAYVWAVEPNLAMSGAATAHPQVDFRQGAAEATGLPTASVDLITCFQAFHWFEPAASLREFHRILQPGGRLAVIWNNRDRRDPFTDAWDNVLWRASNQHPALDRMVAPQPLFEHPDFKFLNESVFPSEQCLDRSELIGLSASRSYVPHEGPTYEQMVADLEELHAEWADDQGYVRVIYQTPVFLAASR